MMRMLVIVMLLVASLARAAEYDVVVYGGTSGGVTAAVQAARMGKRVVLIEPGRHLGGMTSGGLGWTDMGRPEIVGGLAREFYQRIYKHYYEGDAGVWKHGTREKFAEAHAQHTKAVDAKNKVMWVFEPHAAENVFNDMVREAGVTLVFEEPLDLSEGGRAGVAKQGNHIMSIRTESGKTFAAKMFVDATYEGDLMARAGVSYTFGREANDVYGETINGIQTGRATKNQLSGKIDPYVVAGDASSGLLPGVNANAGGPDGSGDQRIQAYCYRMCLTDVADNRVMIGKPQGYDEKEYELLFRAIEAGQSDRFFKLDMMPNRKTDSNNASGISTDFIGMNYDYPEAEHTARRALAKAHEKWQRGLVWTLQNHPRVPKEIREKLAKWGLPKDEFGDTGHWPHQLYVREARRMIGDVIVTERAVVEDTATRPVALGGYSMDSHNVQRHVSSEGSVRNEGDVQIKVGRPYRIDYGVIVPKAAECANLFVPFCVSASHAAFSTIRMEPVFMELGQCAGTAASLAIDGNISVQQVPYETLRVRLLTDGAVLKWQEAKVERIDNRRADARFAFTSIPSPSDTDAAGKAKISILSGKRDVNGGGVEKLLDGKLPSDPDEPRQNFFFAAGTEGGQLLFDLGTAIEIRQINTYSWHADTRGPQVYKVYGGENTDGWRLIAAVDTRQGARRDDMGGQYGVSVGDSARALGKFRYLRFDISRSEDFDSFGNTFFSEIDVIDAAAPAVASTRAAVEVIRVAGKIVTIDVTAAPDLRQWAQEKLLPVCEQWYPKIAAMLPSDGFEPPRLVTIRFRDGMSVPAMAARDAISCDIDWFRRNLKGEAVGAVVHELAHVVQQYGQARLVNRTAARNPGWLVEGIADYVRWFKYEPQTRGAEIRDLEKAKYDASYRVTANFLNWVTQKHGEKVVVALNAAMREGKYADELWKQLTEKSVEELGGEWKQALVDSRRQ